MKPSLKLLNNSQLADLFDRLHMQLGQRTLWLKRLSVQIAIEKKKFGAPSRNLRDRKASWQADAKELIEGICDCEAEMDRRVEPTKANNSEPQNSA